MKPIDYWSKKTNPQTGEKFEKVLDYLRVAHNGNADIQALISSPYAEEMIRLLLLRFAYEEDPMGKEALDYYRSVGLKKEIHNNEDYYTRWVLLTPLDMCNTL